MEPRQGENAARYTAFISYSRQDVVFARRLHRRLETYKLPRRVAGGSSSGGAQARRLGPIFRDQDDMGAEADLTTAVRSAIGGSRHLIVICSPDAAASIWVDREVELFREIHGDEAIHAAICAGSTPDAFPPALRATGADGRARSPLAADFRHGGDGYRLALLKLVAALAGVRLDDLVQRDAQRRIRGVSIATAAAAAGMVGAGALSLAALRGEAAAEAERARSEHVIDFMLTDLRKRLKDVGRLDVLDVVNRNALNYYRGQDLGHLPDAAKIERAKLLQAVGEDAEQRGDLLGARAQFDEARRTTLTLLRAHPDDQGDIYAHAQSEYWCGFIRWRLGDLPGALAGFEGYSRLARHLAVLDPNNPDWLMETGNAESNLGAFVLRQWKDTRRSTALFASALVDFQAADRRRPGDRDIAGSIADGYAWLGDAARIGGDYAAARRYRIVQRNMLTTELKADPRKFEARAALASNDLALGRIASDRGDLTAATGYFTAGQALARALAHEDPENADVAKQARIFDLFQVRAWLRSPAALRPPLKTMVARLGDCRIDAAKRDSEELSAFCALLASRLEIAGHAGPGAENLRTVLHGSRLSEHWLLDLDAEARIASAIGHS